MRVLIIVIDDDSPTEPLLLKEKVICLISPGMEMFRRMHFDHEILYTNDLPEDLPLGLETVFRRMKDLGIEEKLFEKKFELIEDNSENYIFQSLNTPKPKIMTYNSWTSKKNRGNKFNKKLLLNRKIIQKH